MLLNIFWGIFVGSLFGYIAHWIFHKPWSLWFYHAHMNHHNIQYPPEDFLSTTYRKAGLDNSIILFTIASLPIFAICLLSWFVGLSSLTAILLFIAGLISWGLANNYLHDQFHISNSIGEKFPLFMKWRLLHRQHHLDMSTNFGIFFFIWDKLFKTFKENQ